MNQVSSSAVGDIPSGLFIVTVLGKDGSMDGFLASFVQQVSFNPLRIAIAMKPERMIYEQICNGNIFTLNIVGTHKKDIMKLFWNGYDENPFLKLDHTIVDGGVILGDSKSSIVCKMVEKYSPGDHDLIIGDVLACFDNNKDSKSLVHLRKDGSTY